MVSPIRVVLVGGADMLQDVLRQVVDDDPALELVGESATVEGLPALWDRVEADVVIVRSPGWSGTVPEAARCGLIPEVSQ